VRKAANHAVAAAGAYETAFAMTVPPPMITANRVQLATLIATNNFGQNTPAVMATEAEYSEMWAKDARSMYRYAASSRSASTMSNFTSPLRVSAGTTGQACSSSAKTASRATSSVPQALHKLSTPGSSTPTDSGAASTTGCRVGRGRGKPWPAWAKLTLLAPCLCRRIGPMLSGWLSSHRYWTPT